ncbi:MAG: MOSC domain-containing protein, partial [Actinomycetota bacterium]|nr:MOSC domain-containing protein [Actinomycetota bacterium]
MPNATIAALWRYPVKSFQGFPTDSLTLGPRGVNGDRRYALVDSATDRMLSAKSRADLLMATAEETQDGGVLLTLPDAAQIRADDADIAGVLSTWIGRPVILAEADTGEDPLTYDERSRSYEMTFEPEHDAAEYVPIPSPAGTFLDLA